MPKSLMIRSDEVRRAHTVEFKPIPANQFHKMLADERASVQRLAG